MKGMCMQVKRNNKGFSLVEVLIAVGILAIISGSTLLFMRQGSLTYNKTSADVDVQTEAQLTANAITDRVIDCETQLKFYDGHSSVTTDASGATVTVTDSYSTSYKADGVTYTVTDHVLLLTNATSQQQQLIFWDSNRNVIYYNETGWDGTQWKPFDENNAEMIAGNVSMFEVHTNKLDTSKILDFDVEYSQKGKKYKGSYQVHMRNDVVEGAGATPVDPVGNTITKVSVEPSTAYLVSKKNQALTIPGPFTASVVGNGAMQKVTWAMSASPSDVGLEADDSRITDIQFVMKMRSVTPIPEPTVKSFKIVATSTQDTTKSGYATVYVKKATAVNVEPSSDLAIGEEGIPVTTKNSTIAFNGSTDGWNLTRAETGVTWKLYKSTKSSPTGGYSAWTEVTDRGEGYMAGNTAVIMDKVDANYRFKVEATSVFDTAVKGEYVFGISNNVQNVDLKFLRGVNVDLKSYFMANPMKIASSIVSVVSIDSMKLKSVQVSNGSGGYTGDYLSCVELSRDGVLYIDYDAFSGTNLSGKREFYKEIRVELDMKFKTLDGEQNLVVPVTFPAVQVIRVNPMIENIVVRKGNAVDIELYTPGYNLTSTSLMSIYIDDKKVSDAGSSSLNKYISCRMMENEDGAGLLGNRNLGVTNGKFRLTADDVETKYPTKPINLKIAVADFYVASSGDPLSYVQYNVYVANVEGSTQYIPGLGQSGFPTGITGGYKDFNVTVPVSNVSASATKTVKMKKTGGLYYMKYNDTEYVYDTAYNYWKKIR